MKKNNKGFSLVELIVVILIMAILGVALTPQVMKWVNNSRVAADSTNYDALVEACNLALASEAAYSKVKNASDNYIITVKQGSINIKSGSTIDLTEGGANTGISTYDYTGATADAFLVNLKKVAPNWYETRAKLRNPSATASPETGYVITITCGATVKVQKTTPPSETVSE